MNSSPASDNDKCTIKQLEYAKQQEQLRSFGNSRMNNPKPLSADTMIEDLLSKKEIFQKRSPELQQHQEISGWLCGPVPPVYSQVWASVQSANGLSNTPILSSLLMSSGLPTDTLAYLWSLANRTVSGALTQQEVHLVLALVALTQSGYHINNIATVLQLPQAPIPALDLSLLPTPRHQMYPSPLSVTGLSDPHTYNWIAPEIQPPNVSDKIGVSYVSSGPMLSPKLLNETSVASSNLSFTNFHIKTSSEVHDDTSKTSGTSVYTSKNLHTKHSGTTFNFSFPSLNESPSHIASLKSEESDPFEDEFTDFQSADFTSVSNTKIEDQTNEAIEDDDEFSNFQKATPKINDDLSVLVIDGKNIPSAQTLWVTDNLKKSKKVTKERLNLPNTGAIEVIQNVLEPKYEPSVINTTDDKLGQGKYDVFEDIDDDQYSVFHNPLSDNEDNHNDFGGDKFESAQLGAKSIFSNSLFCDPEPSSDLFKSDLQQVSIDYSKSNMQSQKESDTSKQIDVDKPNDEGDDEFSTFQNFPISFPDPNRQSDTENCDKYDVFRTIVFEDNTLEASQMPKAEEVIYENYSQIPLFETGIDLFKTKQNYSKENENDLFGNFVSKISDDIEIVNLQKPFVLSTSIDTSEIDNPFSSLAISDKTCDSGLQKDSPTAIEIIEDKYKALRLIEENPNENDDFGEFSGADVPNYENQPSKSFNHKPAEKPSVQVRCLEACLNLLKDGLATLSRASSQDVVSEVLSDPRASTYLDCLLEVHRVSERIIRNLEGNICITTKAELHQVWEHLGPYFTHTEHNYLTDTVGAQCGVCRSNTGPSPVTFGAMMFHSPCANLYLHCVEPVLPNISSVPLIS